MAIENKPEVDTAEMIQVFGEWRPKNAFYLAVAEQAARNAASGYTEPLRFSPIAIQGEPLSETIIRDRGPY